MAKIKSIIAKKKDKPVTIRFPDGLVPSLDKEAKKAGRSRNSEIVYRLVESLKPEDARKAA